LATVAVLISAVIGDFENGEKLASLALRYSTARTRARIVFVSYGFVHHNLSGYVKCQQPCLDAYKNGLRSGDIESSFWCALMYVQYLLFSGEALRRIERELGRLLVQMKSLDQERVYRTSISFHQCVVNLLRTDSSSVNPYYIEDGAAATDSHSTCPAVMKGPIMTEDDLEKLRKDPDTFMHWVVSCRWKVFCAFWVSDETCIWVLDRFRELSSVFLVVVLVNSLNGISVSLRRLSPRFEYSAERTELRTVS
jgi:hypothetical protein